jgi:hypothetical protein
MALLKVKRDGPKGYRLIDADAFDPAIHEAFDAPVVAPVAPAGEVESLRAQITALGGSFHHKAGAERLRAILSDLEAD